ncbi:hypothetical protein KAW18_00435 [candidate division WOR-3 bacterium]|nr:hypothetical protein [candidate division WOR-3 bacterium]
MKRIECIIYTGIEDQFLEVLEQEQIVEYVMIPRAIGRLKSSEPRMDSHIWPGYFLIYKFCMEDERYERFRPCLKKMLRDWGKEGFMATVEQIEEICGGVE